MRASPNPPTSPFPAVPLQASACRAPTPALAPPAGIRGMRGWGGGEGGQFACRLLPERSRCPRAGPTAAEEWGALVRPGSGRVWGGRLPRTRGTVAAVWEMEPRRKDGAPWNGKQGPRCCSSPVLTRHLYQMQQRHLWAEQCLPGPGQSLSHPVLCLLLLWENFALQGFLQCQRLCVL